MKSFLFSGPYATTRREQPSANLTPARPVGGTGGTAECACRAAGRWCKTCRRACRDRKGAAVCFDFSFLVGNGIVVSYYININVLLKHARLMQRPKALRCAKICTVQDSSGNGDTEETTIQNVQIELQCPICWHYLENPIMTQCNHIFCWSCVNRLLSGNINAVCPMCNKSLKIQENSENLCRSTLLRNIAMEVHVLEEVSNANNTLSVMEPKTFLKKFFDDFLILTKRASPNKEAIYDKCKRIFLTSYGGQNVFDIAISSSQTLREKASLICNKFVNFVQYVEQVHQKNKTMHGRWRFAVHRETAHELLVTGMITLFTQQQWLATDLTTKNKLILFKDEMDMPFELKAGDIVCMDFHKACIGKVLSSGQVDSLDGVKVKMYRVHFPSLLESDIHLCQRQELTFCFSGLQIPLDLTTVESL